MRSVCYCATMNDLDLNTHRIALLRAAIDKVANGNVSEFGRRLGYKDGAFVRQMLGAIRPVSEKTIRAVEALPGLKGWFSQPGAAKVVRAQTRDSAENLPLFADLADGRHPHNKDQAAESKTGSVPIPIQYSVDKSKFRPIPVIGRAQGGMPEVVWSDGDYPVGITDEYAELASSDPHAFICPVVGDSMFPRFMPGEYVLVQPGRAPEIEDTVLVRLATGETMLKRLLSRRDSNVRLGSWNDPTILNFREEEVSWIYTVAHAVPAWMIKQAT